MLEDAAKESDLPYGFVPFPLLYLCRYLNQRIGLLSDSDLYKCDDIHKHADALFDFFNTKRGKLDLSTFSAGTISYLVVKFLENWTIVPHNFLEDISVNGIKEKYLELNLSNRETFRFLLSHIALIKQVNPNYIDFPLFKQITEDISVIKEATDTILDNFDTICVKTQAFGLTISEGTRKSPYDIPVPIYTIIHFLDSLDELDDTLYQASGVFHRVKAIIRQFNQDEEVIFDISETDEAASALISYIRDLHSLWYGRTKVYLEAISKPNQLELYQMILSELPPSHLEFFKVLIGHLGTVCQKTNRSAKEVATCFGKNCGIIFPFMIEHYHALFQ
eukprot:TRINITY_DN6322_c0_g2_i1.p1 TRINITY_DN6322_c0_g2~~TRINITY_DN6322_c0_g2_i1.p1  ORF type:complete len:334 (+),score=58.27 TRINITY_DN6322_c0_g2_i1:719-1720(+)